MTKNVLNYLREQFPNDKIEIKKATNESTFIIEAKLYLNDELIKSMNLEKIMDENIFDSLIYLNIKSECYKAIKMYKGE